MTVFMKTIFILPLLVLLFSCNKTNFTPTLDNKGNLILPNQAISSVCPTPPDRNVYTASIDFSGTQGCRQWSYQESTGALMTYSDTSSRWVGSETYSLLYATGAHPGNSSDVVRKWTSTGAGSIKITGKVSDANATCGTDGVDIFINKGATILWQGTVAAGNTGGLNYDVSANVVAGESVVFVVNKKTNNGCDSTNFDPTITFTPTAAEFCPVPVNPNIYTASSDFSGIQGCRRWSYQESTGALMTYNTLTKQWKGSTTYSLLYNTGAHPGSNSDSIRRWSTPGAGSIKITGKVSDANTTCGTDGVNISIKKGTTVLWQGTVVAGNSTGLGYDVSANVAAGEFVDFIVNRKLDNGCDSTNFDPTVTFTTAQPPLLPTNFKVTGSIFSWTASVGATSYLLRVHEEGTPYDPCTSMAFCAAVSGTSQQVSLKPNTKYDAWIYSQNASGISVEAAGLGFTTPPSTTSQPDLIVTSVTHVNGVFTAVVKNNGAAPTPTGVVIGVEFSVDGAIKTSGNVSGILAAGASATVTGAVNFAMPAGVHSVQAFVDNANSITESNETNNKLAVSVGAICKNYIDASWNKVTANANGATITDLAGYKILYKIGTTGAYTTIRINDPNTISTRLNNLSPGNTYNIALKSFRNVNGTDIDSAQTADVSLNLLACP